MANATYQFGSWIDGVLADRMALADFAQYLDQNYQISPGLLEFIRTDPRMPPAVDEVAKVANALVALSLLKNVETAFEAAGIDAALQTDDRGLVKALTVTSPPLTLYRYVYSGPQTMYRLSCVVPPLAQPGWNLDALIGHIYPPGTANKSHLYEIVSAANPYDYMYVLTQNNNPPANLPPGWVYEGTVLGDVAPSSSGWVPTLWAVFNAYTKGYFFTTDKGQCAGYPWGTPQAIADISA